MGATRNLIDYEVDRREEMILSLIQDLVRIPTFVPPGVNYDRAAELTSAYMREAGFDIEAVTMPESTVDERLRSYHSEVSGPRVNVVAKKIIDQEFRNILWTAHLDTVPYDADEWSLDPLSGHVVDGRIWGRGVADDKGEAACIMAAFAILNEIGVELACNPTIALGCDEEIGPYSGLMYLSDQGYFAGCDLIHGCDGNGDGVYVSFNGAFFWKLTMRGKSAHSSTPSLGINSIERSTVIVGQLLKLKEEILGRNGGGGLIAQPDGESAPPVFNITMARGGLRHNLIPAELILEGDRRFPPEECERDVVRELASVVTEAAALVPDLEVELTITPFYTSWSTDPESPWVQEVKRAASHSAGRPLAVRASPSSCDLSYVAKSTRIPLACFGLGRAGESNTHGADENARVEDILALVKTICYLATES